MEAFATPRGENDVGYLTSFSPDLFEASGMRLLNSYQTIDPQRYFLVCDEAAYGRPAPLLDRWKVDRYDLGNDPFLQNWLEVNKDIIPAHLGGQAQPCSCPGHEERHAKHKPGCYWQWMNRNAARFFRKVAAWRYAAVHWPCRYIIWLDSDCVIRKRISLQRLEEFLKGAAMAYFRGRRPAIESGVLLFDLQKGGREFIQRVCDHYQSGRFRRDERWDDGYILTQMLDKKIFCRDLVNRKKQRGNNVIPQTEVSEFFEHFKGRHGTGLGVML